MTCDDDGSDDVNQIRYVRYELLVCLDVRGEGEEVGVDQGAEEHPRSPGRRSNGHIERSAMDLELAKTAPTART